MKTRFTALIMMTLAGAIASAQVYDYQTNFSVINGNPNGAWTYAFCTSPGGALTVYDVNNGIDHWFKSGWSPFMGCYSTYMHPGPTGEINDARITTTGAGATSIVGSFGQGDIGAVDVYVYKNGASLFTVLGTTVDQPFNINTTVAIGDRLDFMVGAAGDWNNDATPFTVHVSTVPEPATLALFGIGFAALLLKRRRS